MEVIKKITIVAVLIASVVVIITFSPNIYEGIQTNIETRQRMEYKKELEAESQAENDAWWAEQARLDSLAEARWNLLTQEEKCEESLKRRDSFVHEQLNLPNPGLVDSQVTGKVEWANESSEREFESLWSDYRKECETD